VSVGTDTAGFSVDSTRTISPADGGLIVERLWHRMLRR